MKDICNTCDRELHVSAADYVVKHMVCLNKGCRSFGLLVAYPKPEAAPTSTGDKT